MALRILLREHPSRSIAIATDTHALLFHHDPTPPAHAAATAPAPAQTPASPKCVAELSSLASLHLSDYRPLRVQAVYGTLGLINIRSDVFLCVVTASSPVATVRPREEVQRILAVDFVCLNRADFDQGLRDDTPLHYDPYDEYTDSNNTVHHGEPPVEHPCLALKQVLGGGTFYYSTGFDLTNRLQSRASEDSALDVDGLDRQFLWNAYMVEPLIEFRSKLGPRDREILDASQILTSAIRGYIATVTIPASSSPIRSLDSRLPSTLTLISRLSCRRAGTRFNARGIDDDGNVANFVETETVYHFPNGMCFSYAQVRGSVPIFWEQATGLLPQQQKIHVTRSIEATQPAFDRHFDELELKYGVVHVLNLLSESKPGEVELTSRYNYHAQHSSLNEGLNGGLARGQASDHAMLQLSQFDFHAETKGPGGYEAASSVRHLIRDQAAGFAFYLSSSARDSRTQDSMPARSGVVLQQEGVFRTNCLDCLDRTNLVQTIISQMALESFFRQQSGSPLSDFWMRHSTLWADNGDALSKIYAGTGALKSSFTRHGKMSLAGAIADARKSATRLYMNNFKDEGRQNVVDTLLGRLVDQSPVKLFDPINDYVSLELERRVREYSTSEEISIWVGTFNVNGRPRGTGPGDDLKAWLCPDTNASQKSPDIVAVGFQEMVELNPNQILSTDPARRQDWEQAVARTLNGNAKGVASQEYVMLRSGQLVGAALLIFVKSSVLGLIKNVEGSIKKTGMSGMAGNKGAVAIRMDYANTRICFVTAHLAAGFANYDERNRDYRTIDHGLRFQRNRSIEDHDTILWLGDFNYRIGLTNEKVRQFVDAGDLGSLYRNDQLNLQMVAGHTFPFYNEARITFLPTYKYDNGTDEYDTSEKARIPAWCDRILWKGQNLKQINYNTAPLRFSDHRPVFATFQCLVRRDDETEKQRLGRELYVRRREQVHSPGQAANTTGSELDDEDLLGYESIAPGLSPASSDRRKWWLNNGLPARSDVVDIHNGYIPNPARPSNPFSQSPEPDWVVIPKSSTTMQSRVAARQPSLSRTIPPPPGAAQTGFSQQSQAGSSGFPPQQHDFSLPKRVPSNASTSSTAISRKPAPPVPKKPMALSSTSPTGTSESSSFSSPRFIPGAFPGEKPELQAITAGVPPPPRRGTGSSQKGTFQHQTAPTYPVAAAASQKSRTGDDEAGPPLPVRPCAPAPRNMMDEDDEGARHIPSLQPLRRQ